MLDDFRAKAVEICKEPKVLSYFGNRVVGKIYNHAGRARVFDLNEVVDEDGNVIDKSKAERIFRQAGNFPIQGYARHLFGEGLVKLWKDFESDGLVMIKVPDENRPLGYRFENLIYLLATVHDEILLSIDDKINPYYILDELEKCMMAKIENHANYYMGVSYCDNWHDGHSGKYEMSAGCMLATLSRLREKGKIPIMCEGQELEGKDYVKALFDLNYEHSLDEEVDELKKLTSIEKGEVDLDAMSRDFANYELKGFAKDIEVNKEDYSKIFNLVPDGNKEYKSILDIFIKMYLTYISRDDEAIHNYILSIGGNKYEIKM